MNSRIHHVKQFVEFHVLDTDGASVARLLPLNQSTLEHFADVELMSEWRNRYQDCFLTQFKAEPERTRHWLEKSVIPGTDKILFLILVDQKLVGHIGFCNCSETTAEIDNVINTRNERGFFSFVLKTILDIGFELLGLQQIHICYLSGNERAKRAYSKLFHGEPVKIDYLHFKEENDEKQYAVCTENESNTVIRYYTSTITREQYRHRGENNELH